jgi:ADP-heptose:LPS heptosyltransferase
MRILFVTSNRIGDAVLSTGLLSNLVDRYPGARITVACGAVAAPLFRSVPGLEHLHVLVKQRHARHWLGLWRAAIGVRWDLVVDLRASALAWTLWARQRKVFQPSHAPVHRVRQLATLFGLDAAPPAPRLWLSEAQRAEAATLLPDGGPILAIGPTANFGGKEWPAGHFVELIAHLTSADGPLAGARVALFGGPGEREAAAPVIAAIPAERLIDLVGTADLMVAAACIARARLYVGNDSGLMHVAAAVGVPTLGLFGPSREVLYAPWGPQCAHVRGPRSCEEIQSSPLYDYRKKTSHMGDLDVAVVEAAALALLARTEPERLGMDDAARRPQP